MRDKEYKEGDDEPLLSSQRVEGGQGQETQRSLSRRRQFSRLRCSTARRRRTYELQDSTDSDAAFTIVVRKEPLDADESPTSPEFDENKIDITQDLVNECVQDAVQDAVQEAVTETVAEAIQQAIEDNVRFDVRANFFTLIAITGVILFWRGIWSLWDKLFGFSIWSELGSIAAGLVIMITFRLIGVPLLDGLPSG